MIFYNRRLFVSLLEEKLKDSVKELCEVQDG